MIGSTQLWRAVSIGVLACACSSPESPPPPPPTPSTPTPSSPPTSDAAEPEPPSDYWDGRRRFECGEYSTRTQPPARTTATLRKVRARKLDVAIVGWNCDLTIIDCDIEADTLMHLTNSHVRVVGGSLKGEMVTNIADDSTLELTKGAHVVGRYLGDATKVKIQGAEWTMPKLRDEKLVEYARCLAISDVWATKAAVEYLSWARPIEKGRHPTPPSALEANAYDASWCQIMPFAEALPLTRSIDDPARGYATAEAHLAATYKELRIYYTHEDYKDDAFARAPTLHAAYLAAMKTREAASETLRDAIASDLPGAFDRDVAAHKQLVALAHRLSHDGVLLVLAVSARLRPEERHATRDAIIRLCEAIANDYAQIQKVLETYDSPDRLADFESNADALVIVTKKGRRVLAAKDAPGDPASAFAEDLPSLLSRVVAAVDRLGRSP